MPRRPCPHHCQSTFRSARNFPRQPPAGSRFRQVQTPLARSARRGFPVQVSEKVPTTGWGGVCRGFGLGSGSGSASCGGSGTSSVAVSTGCPAEAPRDPSATRSDALSTDAVSCPDSVHQRPARTSEVHDARRGNQQDEGRHAVHSARFSVEISTAFAPASVATSIASIRRCELAAASMAITSA